MEFSSLKGFLRPNFVFVYHGTGGTGNKIVIISLEGIILWNFECKLLGQISVQGKSRLIFSFRRTGWGAEGQFFAAQLRWDYLKKN